MLAALLLLAGLGAWQLYTVAGSVDTFILPAPSDVIASLWDDRALLWSNFTVTAREMGVGLAVSLALGVALAVALHESRTTRRAVYPLLIASQTIPVVLVAPLLVTWFGYGITPKVAIVALVCFFPIVVPTLSALGAVDPGQRKLMTTLGASRWQLLRHVEAPSALPALFVGARLSVAVGAIAAVLAETAGSESGLGHLMLQSIPQLETARAFAAVAVLSLFSLALYLGLTLAQRRLLPWAPLRPEGPTP
jgi:ABC-type nitrate/sulfonate/bicarbonate transport system permease component